MTIQLWDVENRVQRKMKKNNTATLQENMGRF
jgi:hypothetical protein